MHRTIHPHFVWVAAREKVHKASIIGSFVQLGCCRALHESRACLQVQRLHQQLCPCTPVSQSALSWAPRCLNGLCVCSVFFLEVHERCRFQGGPTSDCLSESRRCSASLLARSSSTC